MDLIELASINEELDALKSRLLVLKSTTKDKRQIRALDDVINNIDEQYEAIIVLHDDAELAQEIVR